MFSVVGRSNLVKLHNFISAALMKMQATIALTTRYSVSYPSLFYHENSWLLITHTGLCFVLSYDN